MKSLHSAMIETMNPLSKLKNGSSTNKQMKDIEES